MAAQLQRPLEELTAENAYLAAANAQLRTSLERFRAYLFSSQGRKLLFEKKGEKEEILIFSQKIQAITKFNDELRERTFLFLRKISKQNTFSQPRHHHQALAYLQAARHQQRKCKSIFQDVAQCLVQIREQPSPARRSALARQLRRLLGNALHLLEENQLYLGDFQGRSRIEHYINQDYESLLQQNIIRHPGGWRRLQSGDIWLSFKTLSFLKRETISHWISRFTGSQVTHAALFIYDSAMNPVLIHSAQDVVAGFYRIKGTIEGEVFIVLRPRLNAEQRVALWRVVREMIKKKIGFSKLKLVGVLPSLALSRIVSLFSGRAVTLGNIAGSSRAAMFCSEFINEAFRNCGFYLTPKSRHSSMVFPSDIIASPAVDYVGLIFDDDKFTQDRIMKELVKGVKI